MHPGDIVASFKGRHVVITGGTGMIGRSIAEMLAEAGAHVTVVSLDNVVVHPEVRHVVADLTSLDRCLELLDGADDLFHVAGVKGSIEVTRSKPASFFVPLMLMNTSVLEAARRRKVQRVVYTSSIGAYASHEIFVESERLEDDFTGLPMDMFPGWAKRMAELQIEAYRIQYGMDNMAVVRPCNVYGPGDNFDPANAMVVPSLMARIKAGESPLKVWGDGSAVRDFAYSADVALGTIQALYHGTKGRYLNLGGGRGYTIKELVETLAKVTKFDYVFDATKSSGFPRRVMDISLAGKMIGYEPQTSLEAGLRATWDWYLANPDEYVHKVNYFTGDSPYA